MAKILIIDDDASLRKTMMKIVALAGHTAHEAKDGEVGLALFKAGHYDLVVTDLLMPEKEGIETIIELRSEKPDVKILAVSGGLLLDPVGPLEDAESLGADASLPKPFSVDEFSKVVESLLGG